MTKIQQYDCGPAPDSPPIRRLTDWLAMLMGRNIHVQHYQRVRHYVRGLLCALLNKQERGDLTLSHDVVQQYTALPLLLNLCKEVRQYKATDQLTSLEVYLSTLPGINMKTCTLIRWVRTAEKRHQALIQSHHAVSMLAWQIKKMLETANQTCPCDDYHKITFVAPEEKRVNSREKLEQRESSSSAGKEFQQGCHQSSLRDQ